MTGFKQEQELIALQRRPVKWTCPTCNTAVFEPFNGACKVCVTIAYLNFRHAFNWPLDEEDKKALGLT